MPPSYPSWLSHVFDHPVTSPEWFFSTEAPAFKATSEELVDLIRLTMINCGKDLCGFSDGQINDGLHYIFNNSCSDIVFSLMDTTVAVEKRQAAVRSIKQLYAECLRPRCAPVLCHLDEPGSNPLNNICYILWDVSPLSYWEGRKDKQVFYDTVLDVLRFALDSENIACVESALHGLGHLQRYQEASVTPIIRNFIRDNPRLRMALRQYAESAAIGCVQ